MFFFPGHFWLASNLELSFRGRKANGLQDDPPDSPRFGGLLADGFMPIPPIVVAAFPRRESHWKLILFYFIIYSTDFKTSRFSLTEGPAGCANKIIKAKKGP